MFYDLLLENLPTLSGRKISNYCTLFQNALGKVIVKEPGIISKNIVPLAHGQLN